MSRRILVTVALAAAAMCLAATPLLARAANSDPRGLPVTRGLDCLHACQQSNGGFGTMASTAWSVLAIAASGERVDNKAWAIGGKTPFTFMQARSHNTAASAYDVENPVVYYAQAIMAYVAAGQPGRVFQAGTPRIDLLAKLYSYQDLADGPTKGSFSPSSSSRKYQAVHTTAWAIAAMEAIGESESGGQRFDLAISWLAGQQRADGGFPAQEGLTSNVEDTAMAIQALRLPGAPGIDPSVIPAARAYLKACQRNDGGFPYLANGVTSATATSAAIQAILALGEDPDSSTWAVGGKTPRRALAALQRSSGAFNRRPGKLVEPIPTTSWALTAYRKQAFTIFPRRRPAAITPFVFRPTLTAVSPKQSAKFTSTRSVLLRASYSDGSRGTGVDPGMCRLFVDGKNRTKAAGFGRSSVRLQLKNLANGAHTWEIRVVDFAGNVQKLKRTFTVSVPQPTPTQTPTRPPVPRPAPIAPSTTIPPSTPVAPSTTITPSTPIAPSTAAPRPTPTPYPTPTATLYPSPSASPLPDDDPMITGSVIPSPSASPSPSSPPDGGSGAGFVSGTLLAMFPIGIALSSLVLERRTHALSQASEGQALPGGGSAWERVKRTVAESKNLFKRAGS